MLPLNREKMNEQKTLKIAIVGGGASGFFTAIRCAETAQLNNRNVEITIFERAKRCLQKVKISGGGRCNVTHNIFEKKRLIENYPRGKKELLSPFCQFSSADTLEWFSKKGIEIVSEADGRMFPVTNDSQTIIDCFYSECNKYGVEICNSKNVISVDVNCSDDSQKDSNSKFVLNFTSDDSLSFDRLVLSTGSVKSSYSLAQNLGHTITELAPSLFTFKIKSPLIEGLSGTSFKNAHLKLKIANAKPFVQQGPLLITHWGLSGPALLKLSAWAAREMKTENYVASLTVNWVGVLDQAEQVTYLNELKSRQIKSNIVNTIPLGLTKRFWESILRFVDIPLDKKWADISNKELEKIKNKLFSSELSINGKSRFKEEFVECGGVNLKEVNFKTMESKKCSHLYFTGELLDIDGITGGFNFQNAWTTGWIAGSHLL